MDGYSGWVHFGDNNNAIIGYNLNRPYYDHENQLALKNGRLKLSWYDYLLGHNTILSGLINAIILKGKY